MKETIGFIGAGNMGSGVAQKTDERGDLLDGVIDLCAQLPVPGNHCIESIVKARR